MIGRGALVWYLLILLALGGCAGDPRQASVLEGMKQARAVVQQPELAKLAEKHKGSAEERRLAALFSPEGHKCWPTTGSQEFRFAAPVTTEWPSRILILSKPDVPWSVVLEIDKQDGSIVISGYGAYLENPLAVDRIKL